MVDFKYQAQLVANFYRKAFPISELPYSNRDLIKVIKLQVAMLACCEVYQTLSTVSSEYKTLLLDLASTIKYSIVSLGMNNQFSMASSSRALLDSLIRIMYYSFTKDSLAEVQNISFRNSKDFLSGNVTVNQIHGHKIYSLYSKYSNVVHGSTGFRDFYFVDPHRFFSSNPISISGYLADYQVILDFIASGIPRLLNISDSSYTIAQRATMNGVLGLIR